MRIIYSSHFLKRLKKHLKKNPSLKPAVGKQLKLLQRNPNHPSLKIHKLAGSRAQEYAIWIKRNLRITFVVVENAFLLTDLITHDEY